MQANKQKKGDQKWSKAINMKFTIKGNPKDFKAY